MSSRGQLKIQEMAFVLLAIMLFFGIVALIYFALVMNDLREQGKIQSENEANALVKRMISIPEFSWTKQCSTCIDHDKILALKYVELYNKTKEEFWNLDYLAIEQIYPKKAGGECMNGNYPNCNITTVISKKINYGKTSFAYVALCRWNNDKNQNICELARIVVSSKDVKDE